MPANKDTKVLGSSHAADLKKFQDNYNKQYKDAASVVPRQNISTPWQDYASGKSKVRPKG